MAEKNTSRQEQVRAALARWERWALMPLDPSEPIRTFREEVPANIAWSQLSEEKRQNVFIVDLARGQALQKDPMALQELIKEAEQHRGQGNINIFANEESMRALNIMRAYYAWQGMARSSKKRCVEDAILCYFEKLWPEIEAAMATTENSSPRG